MSRRLSKDNIFTPQPFSTREMKVIVRYLCYQDVDPSEIHKLLTAACGRICPSYKDVRSWIQDVMDGKEELDDCVCAGGRKMSGMNVGDATDPALVARIENLILADHRISEDKLSELSNTEVPSIQKVINNLLGLKRVCEKWVPRMWTPEQREYRMVVCKQLLDMFQEEGQALLSRMIVGDASFVLYHSPIENSSSENKRGRYRPAEEPERVYCAFFYDIKGMIASEVLPSSSPITEEDYAKLLRDTLVPAIKRKRGEQAKPIFLLHSVTPEHSSVLVQETMRDLNIIAVPHAVASPDLEPFEYWLQKSMRRGLDGLHFNSRVDLWSAVQRYIYGLTDMEYSNSIDRLVDRWNNCIEKGGLYLL